MTIEDMAREANLVAWTADGAVCSAGEALARFAALVRAQALEDAARVCDSLHTDFWAGKIDDSSANACAAAVRALKDKP